jgi:hypothetical protein
MNTCVFRRRLPSAAARFAAAVLLVSAAIPVSADPAATAAANAASAGTDTASTRSEFERLLEQGDFGTFKMYMRLPDASRDGVFQSYRGGASLEEVKAAVLNAFLHK